MNKILSVIIIVFVGFQTTAQTSSKDKDQSNAEIFSSKSGTLLQKEFIDLSNVKACKIQILHFKDQSQIRNNQD